MRVFTLVLLLAAVVFVECGHTFLGSNVMRHLVFHKEAKYPSKFMQKRIEYLNFTLPASRYPRGYYGASIQGILAYDLTNSGASVNVTEGGIGSNFVKLRMKSDRGTKLDYDIYIYA